MIERFWLLYGYVHQGTWPPVDITGPYDDEGAAVAAYDASRGLPALVACVEERPTTPKGIGVAGVLEPTSTGGT